MGSAFTLRLGAILRTWLTPKLKALGFRKRGETYLAPREDLSWVIDMQRSKWNDPEQAEFTINCGVFVEGVVSTYLDRPPPKRVRITECCVDARIGMLSDPRTDIWWEMSMQDDVAAVDRAIGEDMVASLERHALPFLRRFGDVEAVAEFLSLRREGPDCLVMPRSDAISLAYAGILFSKLGETSKSRRALQAALEAARASRVEFAVDHTAALARRVLGP